MIQMVELSLTFQKDPHQLEALSWEEKHDRKLNHSIRLCLELKGKGDEGKKTCLCKFEGY
jgi:hypothetical protein